MGKGIQMSEIVDSLIASAQTISSPESSISGDASLPLVSTDTQSPVIADFLELSAFYSPSATEFSPEITYKIRNKISDIGRYIGEQFENVPNEDEVRSYLADIITRNKLDKLSPSDKLDAIYDYIDLSKRMNEIKSIKKKMKALHVQIRSNF